MADNILPTSAIVAAKAIPLLKSILIYRELLANGLSSDLKAEFSHSVGETVNIRTPGNYIAKDFNGNVVKQATKNGTIPVKLDYFVDVTTELSQVERQLYLQDYMEQVVAPAMLALGEKVDARISNHIFQAAVKTVAEANDTEKLDAIASCGYNLDKAKAPKNDRYLVMSAKHKYRYALKDQLSKASYAGSNETLKTAMLGRVYNFDTMYTTITPESEAETSGTAKGSFNVESSATAGEVKITGLSSATATVKAGEGFCYGDRRYTFIENGTGVSSAITSIKVASDDNELAYDDAGVVSDFPTGVTATNVRMIRGATSIALQKDAYVFVPVPLEGVDAGQGVDTAVATENGLSVRVSRWYSGEEKKHFTSFDILFGIASIRPEHSTVIVDSF